MFDLRGDVLNLVVNVLDEAVMGDGSLCGREHGLFLGEENVLLVLCEVALQEGLGETEMLNLRMSELSVAEHALGYGDVIAAEECLIAGAACALGTGVKGAANGFACGSIERIKADGAGHICSCWCL